MPENENKKYEMKERYLISGLESFLIQGAMINYLQLIAI